MNPGTGQPDLEIGEHTLTSVTSLLDYKTREIVDVDFSGISFLDGTNLREDYRQFSQELRLTSPGGEAFNYIGGVYYQHAKLDVQDFTLFNPTFLGLGAPFNDARADKIADLGSGSLEDSVSKVCGFLEIDDRDSKASILALARQLQG